MNEAWCHHFRKEYADGGLIMTTKRVLRHLDHERKGRFGILLDAMLDLTQLVE